MTKTRKPNDLGALAVDVRIADADWRKRLPRAAATCRRAMTAAWQAADTPFARKLGGRDAEVSVLLAGDDEVAGLNVQYRGKKGPTNVLSFPGIDAAELKALPAGQPVPLGDVVIALGVTMREADEQAVALADHFRHLAVHGMLHLLGYDHIEDGDAAVMENLETSVLAGLGVADPYARDDAARAVRG
jgi:probable rRNA maturation factor